MLHGTWSPQQGLHRPAVKRARRPENAETNAALLRWLSCWWNEARSRAANSAAPEAQPSKSPIAAPSFFSPLCQYVCGVIKLSCRALSLSGTECTANKCHKHWRGESVGRSTSLSASLVVARQKASTNNFYSQLRLRLLLCSCWEGPSEPTQWLRIRPCRHGWLPTSSTNGQLPFTRWATASTVLDSGIPVGGVPCKPTHLAA